MNYIQRLYLLQTIAYHQHGQQILRLLAHSDHAACKDQGNRSTEKFSTYDPLEMRKKLSFYVLALFQNLFLVVMSIVTNIYLRSCNDDS